VAYGVDGGHYWVARLELRMRIFCVGYFGNLQSSDVGFCAMPNVAWPSTRASKGVLSIVHVTLNYHFL